MNVEANIIASLTGSPKCVSRPSQLTLLFILDTLYFSYSSHFVDDTDNITLWAQKKYVQITDIYIYCKVAKSARSVASDCKHCFLA